MTHGAGSLGKWAKTSLKAVWPAMALAVLALLPFVTKPYTIDDPIFLGEARHLLTDPLHPTAFELVWNQERSQHASAFLPGGPLAGYLLVPIAAVGAPEWVAHSYWDVWLLAGLWATSVIALRLGMGTETARRASLILASMPVVLGIAGTIMPDIPAMALATIGLERTLAYRESRGRGVGMFTAVCLAAAALARSHAVLILAVAGIALVWGSRGPRDLARLWPVVLGGLIIAAGLHLTGDPQAERLGGGPGHAAISQLYPQRIVPHVVLLGLHLCIAIPLALPWMVLRFNRLRLLTATAVIPLAIAVGLKLLPLAVALSVIGLIAVGDLVRRLVEARTMQSYLLLAWILSPLAVLPYIHFPSKYLLLAAPALALVLGSELQGVPKAVGRTLLGGIVAGGVVVGMLILQADAGMGRRSVAAANSLIRPAVARGERVWFIGHWGWHWYAELAGARPISNLNRPAAGDLVVASSADGSFLLSTDVQHSVLTVLSDSTPGGRIMSASDGAGFYSEAWGPWPWVWGRAPLVSFEVWRLHEPWPSPPQGLVE